MTKQLEQILNMAPQDDDDDDIDIEIDIDIPDDDIDEIRDDLSTYNQDVARIDKIDAALPQVEDLADNDREMDELAKRSLSAYSDIFDLGMNVDTKYSGRLFEVAATMLGHAITAKTNKVNAKLKTIDLQLKKERLNNMAQKQDTTNSVDGQGELVDRNEMIKQLVSKKDT